MAEAIGILVAVFVLGTLALFVGKVLGYDKSKSKKD
jgi:hypothetical protein